MQGGLGYLAAAYVVVLLTLAGYALRLHFRARELRRQQVG